jgi:hypothetical protein
MLVKLIRDQGLERYETAKNRTSSGMIRGLEGMIRGLEGMIRGLEGMIRVWKPRSIGSYASPVQQRLLRPMSAGQNGRRFKDLDTFRPCPRFLCR